jgi:hypothetical protein
MSNGFIPDSYYDNNVDRSNSVYLGINANKRADRQMEAARVVSYEPKTHTAEVIIFNAGGENTIRVKGMSHYQGSVPGSGEAHTYYKGQLVLVEFMNGSATGIYNNGTIVGTIYTAKDSHAPAYAPFVQNGTGSVVVRETKEGKWGYAEHIDNESNISRTNVAKTNTEDWGNEHVLQQGPNITRAEEVTRRAGAGAAAAANMLG